MNGPLPSGELQRLEGRLLRKLREANRRFDLLEDGDKVMVGLSGGKDSWALLFLLRAYERMVPFSFSFVAVNLDQGQPGFSSDTMRARLEAEGFEHHLIAKDTYSAVVEHTPQGKAFCPLCSRLRRGILYDFAESIGATKIALGHHADDLAETLLLNLWFAGQLKSMAPRLSSDDGRNTIIRPLALTREAELARYAAALEVPILPCDLCGSQSGLKRVMVKQRIAELEREVPDVVPSMLAAMGNIKASHLLGAGVAEAPSLVQIRSTSGRPEQDS